MTPLMPRALLPTPSTSRGTKRKHENESQRQFLPPKRTRYAESEITPRSFHDISGKFYLGAKQFKKSNNERFTELSQNVWQHFSTVQASSKVFHDKIELWHHLHLELRNSLGNDCQLLVFGSTLNGFGGRASDVDMCLFSDKLTEKTEPSTARNQQNHRKDFLCRVRNILKRRCGRFLSHNIELVPAKVPILKFFDHAGNFEVDLSCNNETSIRNTHLLFSYSQLDWRVRPLVIAIKAWAKYHDINEARFQTLSSYVLTLMVLHFLQYAVTPPVLPSLQAVAPDTFNNDTNILGLSFAETPSFQSDNKMSLGELFFRFFEYYVDSFDFARDVGSVRTGQRLDNRDCEQFAKQVGTGIGQWNAHVCMEEPFDRTNAGRATCKRDRFEIILDAFRNSFQQLREGRQVVWGWN